MVEFTVPEVDYTQYSNRQLASVPLAVLAVALLILGGWYLATDAPVRMGTEFTGGTELRVSVDAPNGQADAVIRDTFEAPVESIRLAPASGEHLVTFGADAEADAIESAAKSSEQLTYHGLSEVSAGFGKSLQITAIGGIAVAFLGMSILVFLMFRTYVPSLAVVISAFSDMIIPLALMNIFGIELSLGTVAALLMLIGYSVDSDILLNTHILRRPGDFYESTHRAMRTGVTMTVTSLSAMAAMALAATLFGVQLLSSIGIVLVFGLATDLMNTYMLNVSLLRWYKFEGVSR